MAQMISLIYMCVKCIHYYCYYLFIFFAALYQSLLLYSFHATVLRPHTSCCCAPT